MILTAKQRLALKQQIARTPSVDARRAHATRKEIAEAMGISRVTLQRWLSGTQGPPDMTTWRDFWRDLLRLAAARRQTLGRGPRE